jgi:ribosomal protein L3 glutamine methyltransferase
MLDPYVAAREELHTLLDFLRFAQSLTRAENLFYGHGTDNAWDDTLLLILGSLSLPRDLDPMFWQARLTQDEKNRLSQRLQQRIKERVPVPYLTNEAYFCDLTFYVDERVLIPRSPIAELIETQFSPWIETENVHHILDLCTGSACIAIACCYAFPDALVDAVDISSDALAVAAINQKRHGLEEQLQLLESDVFENLPNKHYDIIVSNPPYVSHEEMQVLPPEYRHEPKLALEAEQDGLAVVKRILKQAAHYLSEQGILILEVGHSEAALLAAYPTAMFTWLEFARGGQGVFMLTREQLMAMQ